MFAFQVYHDAESFMIVSAYLSTIKKSLRDLFVSLDEPEHNEDDPFGWASLNDEIEGAETFESIKDLVYTFACETETTFRFYEFEDGERIELMS